MKRVALTGSIGSGKSTVTRLLREQGVAVLDADEAARALGSDPQVVAEVGAAFGDRYVRDGALDRKAVAALVFGDDSARLRLNAIIHPRVRARLAAEEAALRDAGAALVVQDIPLLFESGLEGSFDATVLVDAPLELRLQRSLARDGSSREAFLARDRAQMPATEKRKRATFVLENDGSLDDLARQVDGLLARMRAEERPA